MSIHDIELTEENRHEIENAQHSFREFEYLVTSHQSEVRQLVAKNQHLPNEYAQWMVNDVEVQVRVALATNLNLNVEVVNGLAQDQKISVLIQIARHPKLSKEIILKFANHKTHSIRDAVATNESATAEILNKLSTDTQWGVRRSVAGNKNVTSEILSSLIDNGTVEEEELDAIAKNQTSSEAVLHKLFEKVSQWQGSSMNSVIEKIIGHPNYPESAARNLYETLLQAEKDRESKSDEEFEFTVEIDRNSVASRIDLSPDFTNILMQDPNARVRETLGANPTVSDEILGQLALDSDESVRTAVHKNPSSSAETKATALLLGIEKSEDDN